MKKIILSISILMLGITLSYAQCGKNLILASSKTEYLDSNMVVQRTVEENSIIEISKSALTIVPGNPEQKMTFMIKSDSCKWNIPFKEGKTVIKVTMRNPNNDEKNATITIEGKDGRVILLMEQESMPDKKIRVTIEKFEEKK